MVVLASDPATGPTSGLAGDLTGSLTTLEGASLLGDTLQLLGFVALCLLLASGWGRARAAKPFGGLLMLASVASALDALVGILAPMLQLSSRWPSAADMAATATWVVFLLVLATGRSRAGLAALTLAAALGIAGPSLAPAVEPAAHLLLALAGLLLIERVYRLSAPDRRWALKLLLIGLGGGLVVDTVLSADALLLTGADPGMSAARGYVQALTVPLIAAAIARNPDWAHDIHVARRAIVGGVVVAATLAYVLGTMVVGLQLRGALGQLGGVAQAVAVTMLLMALMLLTTSGRVRSAITLLIARTFFSYRFDYREEWPRFIKTLSGEGDHSNDSLGDRVILAVADLVDSTGGAIWLHRGRGIFDFSTARNLPFHDCHSGVDAALATRLSDSQQALELVAGSEGLAGSAWPGWMPSIERCWLLLPLRHRGRLLGLMLLARPRVLRVLDREEIDLLAVVAREAASYIAEDEAASRLRESQELESFNRRFAFVMHDIKNIAAQLTTTLANARRHRDNPSFYDDMLETLDASVERMSGLILRIRGGDRAGAGRVDLDGLLAELAGGEVRLARRLVEGAVVRGDKERLRMALAHLVDNARESAPGQRRVEIDLERRDGLAVVEIRDDGAGMDPAFVKLRLFRPFASTKPGGIGLGMVEVKDTIESLGGRIEVESRPGAGSIVRLLLPLAGDLAA